MAEFNRTSQADVDRMIRTSLDAAALNGPSSGTGGRTNGDIVQRMIGITMKSGGLGTPVAPRLPPVPGAAIRRGR